MTVLIMVLALLPTMHLTASFSIVEPRILKIREVKMSTFCEIWETRQWYDSKKKTQKNKTIQFSKVEKKIEREKRASRAFGLTRVQYTVMPRRCHRRQFSQHNIRRGGIPWFTGASRLNAMTLHYYSCGVVQVQVQV